MGPLQRGEARQVAGVALSRQPGADEGEVDAGRGELGFRLTLIGPLAKELTRTLGGTLRAQNRGGRPAFALALPAAGS
jgi:hypothetical protein